MSTQSYCSIYLPELFPLTGSNIKQKTDENMKSSTSALRELLKLNGDLSFAVSSTWHPIPERYDGFSCLFFTGNVHEVFGKEEERNVKLKI